MPTYVYACQSCEHQFEIFQSFSDKARRTCPECKELQLRKVLFPARVGFKGSGFYVTDSKASSISNGASASSSSDGASTSSSAESDTKTASTSSSSSAKSGSKSSSNSSSSSSSSSSD